MIELDAITTISQRPKPTQTSWIHIVLTYFIISYILPTSSYTFLPVYPHLWCYMKSPPECTSRNDRGHQSWSVQCEDLPPNLRWRNPGTISWSASSKIRKKKNTTKSHSYHSYFVQFNAFFVHFVNFSFLENPTPNLRPERPQSHRNGGRPWRPNQRTATWTPPQWPDDDFVRTDQAILDKKDIYTPLFIVFVGLYTMIVDG